MKKILTVAVLLCMFCGVASAFGFDVRGGVNVSGMTLIPKSDARVNFSPQIGYHGSVNADFTLWKGLCLETGVGIEQRGAFDHEMYSDYSLNYLVVPLGVSYRYALDDKLTVYAEIGGWGSYGLWGDIGAENMVYDAFDTFARRLDAGVMAGFGAVIYGHIHFGFRYSYGLLNIATEAISDDLGNIFTNGMCFQLGWRF